MKHKIFVQILFGIVLGILVASFTNVGISLIYKEPEYSDFCEESFIARPIDQEQSQEGIDKQRVCNEEYQKTRDMYNRVVFLILAPIGLILLILGTTQYNLVIQIMLMGSGFLNTIIGILRNLNDKLSVFITIGILIVIGVLFTLKKLKD